MSEKLVAAWWARAAKEYPSDLRAAAEPVRYTLCHVRETEIADSLVELFIQLVQKINTRAEKKVEGEFAGRDSRSPGMNTSGSGPGRIPRGLGRVHANRAPPSPTPMRFGWCRSGGQLSCSRASMSPRVARRSVRCFARVGVLGVVGQRGPLDVVVGRGPAGQQVQGVLRG